MAKECPSCHKEFRYLLRCNDCGREFCNRCADSKFFLIPVQASQYDPGPGFSSICPDCRSGDYEVISDTDDGTDSQESDERSSFDSDDAPRESSSDDSYSGSVGGDGGGPPLGFYVVMLLLLLSALVNTNKQNVLVQTFPQYNSLEYSSQKYEPPIPEIETQAVIHARQHFGPGSAFEFVGGELKSGDRVSIKKVKQGWCMINSTKNIWVDCGALVAPPGGWVDTLVPLPPDHSTPTQLGPRSSDTNASDTTTPSASNHNQLGIQKDKTPPITALTPPQADTPQKNQSQTNEYCWVRGPWILEEFCRDTELAALNNHLKNLWTIFAMANGGGDTFELQNWQAYVEQTCGTAQSRPDCLRTVLEARSQWLQAIIPQVLASPRPAVYKEIVRKRWETNDW